MRKKLIIILVILFLLVSVAALLGYFYILPRFPENAVICGVNVSRMLVRDASSQIEDAIGGYTVTVHAEGKQRTFTSEELSISLNEGALEQQLLGLQREDNASILNMDTKPLKEWLDASIPENRVEPILNHLVWNPESCLFELTGEVAGAYNDRDIAFQIVMDSILRLEETVVLTEADYRVEYTYPVQDALDLANALVSRELTYNYHLRNGEYATETITPSMIGSWAVVGENGRSVSWNKESILAYAKTMAERYSIQGEDTFLAHDGRTIDLRVAAPANLVDAQALQEDILSAILNMEEGEREVPYTEQCKGWNYDGTYIEVSIGEQKLYAYKNGELFVETDIITGCMHCYHGTRTGVFKIQNRGENLFLQNRSEYFVRYWMGFYIPRYGLHDADGWRTEYGGDTYLTNGSGGCVNVPRAVIAQLYEAFDIGTPVIIYDESYVISEDLSADAA